MKTKHKHWAIFTASILGLTGLACAATVGHEKYTHDSSGNIIEKSIDGEVTKLFYDASNKVMSIDSASNGIAQISYDAADRPISYNDPSGQVTRQISYGYADKVVQANSSGGEADFFYNAEGQLVGKSAEGKFTPYTWDGNVVAAEGAETFTNEDHVTGGVPVMAANREAIVSDYLGNTLCIADQSFTSTAFGEGLEEGRFTGKVFVKELGGYSFLHRLFAPEVSRWTTSDPSGFPEGTNNSLYVKSDPCGDVDPLGLVGAGVKTNNIVHHTWVTAAGTPVDWDTDEYRIVCDDGLTTVIGYKPVAGTNQFLFDLTHNCYGRELAGSGYWINDYYSIITGDRWKPATDGDLDSAKTNIAMYSGHTAGVSTITNKTAIKVTGKNGALSGTSTTDPDKQWSYGAPSHYYEK